MPGDPASAAEGGAIVLVSDACRKAARSLLGIAGYAVAMFRPDGALAYSAISQQVSQNFTNVAWRCTLQFARYMVDSSP